MDTYRSKMYAASLVPVTVGTKIKFLTEGIGTGLFVKVVAVKENFDGKGLNVAYLSDETYIKLPANDKGEFEIKYYGSSSKREYFCRTEPTWTAEQRKEVEDKVFNRTHKDHRGEENGERAIMAGMGSMITKLRDISNADLFDMLHYLDQYYPAP